MVAVDRRHEHAHRRSILRRGAAPSRVRCPHAPSHARRDEAAQLRGHRRHGARTGTRHAARRRHDRRRLGQGAGRAWRRAGTRSRRATCRSTGSPSGRRRACAPPAGFPMEFVTIAVSDGISMGHEGMRGSLVSREIIADSVECMMHSERLDALVTFAGCDKSLPGMLMAAARHQRAVGVPLRRLDPPRPLQGPGARHRQRLRGGRRVRGRHADRERARRDREARLPDRGFVRRDVHRQHDGVGRRRRSACRFPGASCATGRRPPARRLRVRVRACGGRTDRGRDPAAPDHDQGGVRERDRGHHGRRRLHERRCCTCSPSPTRRAWSSSSTTSTASARRCRTSPT